MRTIQLAFGVGIVAGIVAFVYLTASAILTAFIIIGQFLAGIILVTLPYVGWMYYRRERSREFRAVDGAFPLQRQKLAGGGYIYIDPNKMVSAAGVFHPEHGWTEIEPVAGWETQRAIALAIQHTRSLAAITPGDDAMIRTHGSIMQPKLPASITKMIPTPKPDQLPPVPAPVPSPQNLITATNGPQTTRLAIGEDSHSGALVSWDLTTHPFVRIHGATRSGKTNLALLLVAQAIRHGFEVVILDRRRGKDWGIFQTHAQVIDARDSAVLINTLKEEVARYEARDELLGKHGAADLKALAQKTGKSYKRRLIVVEEMGTQTLQLKAQKGDVYENFNTNLIKLTTEAGATGIHGLYIDQVPKVWDGTVRYNCAAIIFSLSDYGGRVAGYPLAHKLKKYQCFYDGQIINAGHLTDEQLRRTINLAPAPVRDQTHTHTTGGEHPVNTENTNTTPNSPAANQEAAKKFIKANPKAGVNALARHLAALAQRPDEWRNYQSEASRWWHVYHSPAGNTKTPIT